MLVGSVPFDDASIPQILIKHLTEMPLPPSSVNPGVPPGLEAIVLRLLEKDPDRRYQNAEALIEALDGVEDIAVEIAAAPTIARSGAHAGCHPGWRRCDGHLARA